MKNQFRTLGDDEVEFLDSVLESTRAKEAAVKKETAEQLEAFRQQREAAEKALLDKVDNQQSSNTGTAMTADQETWATSGKKRRRPKEKDTLVGTKLRKTSSSAEKDGPAKPMPKTDTEKQTGLPEKRKDVEIFSRQNPENLLREQPPAGNRTLPATANTSKTIPSPTSALGLGEYNSDDD